MFSFIQSLNTNFGAAIFEPVAAVIAKPRFIRVETQAIAGQSISDAAHAEIQGIIDCLTTGACEPNRRNEVERLRKTCHEGKMSLVKLTRVDVLVEAPHDKLYLFDLKTAKPNAGNFKEFKRMLLEWTAAVLLTNPELDVNAAIAIPYNPYEPKPYSRWTMRGMLDISEQLFVGKELWDFLGGEGAYEQLLDIFEQVGLELRPEIDARFAQFHQ